VPRSKVELTIVQVNEDGTIKDVEPIEMQNTYAQIECDASGNILDSNFARHQKVEEFYQVDLNSRLINYDPRNPRPSSIFGLVPVDKDGMLEGGVKPVSTTNLKVVHISNNGEVTEK